MIASVQAHVFAFKSYSLQIVVCDLVGNLGDALVLSSAIVVSTHKRFIVIEHQHELCKSPVFPGLLSCLTRLLRLASIVRGLADWVCGLRR